MSCLPTPTIGKERIQVSRGAIWFGLLGGACAWLTHLMLAYAIAEFGCVGSLKERTFLHLSAVAWLLLAMSGATLVVAAAATLVAYRWTSRLGARLGQDTVAVRSNFPASGERKPPDATRTRGLTHPPRLFPQEIMPDSLLDGQGRDLWGYLALIGLITSGLFVLAILVESVPIFYYLHRC